MKKLLFKINNLPPLWKAILHGSLAGIVVGALCVAATFFFNQHYHLSQYAWLIVLVGFLLGFVSVFLYILISELRINRLIQLSSKSTKKTAANRSEATKQETEKKTEKPVILVKKKRFKFKKKR